MSSQSPVSPFVPQEYQILYLSIDDNLQTEVQSINVVRTDGGADVETLVRQYGGRVKGSAKADVTVRGVIPYNPDDLSGVAFENIGLTANPGVQLDQTILSNFNENLNKPVKFTVAVGYPAVQQLIFKGFIHQMTVDVSVGKQADFTFMASGQFSTFA